MPLSHEPQIKLLQIDDATRKPHVSLDASDICVYWRSYTTGKDWRFSPTNDLIKNFKISPTDKRRLKYKKNAIEQIAREFSHVIRKNSCQSCTFVPIPPSKPLDHEAYDDRLQTVLNRISELKDVPMDIRPLIQQTVETKPDRLAEPGQRNSIKELISIYRIEKSLITPKPEKIVIFDDILTKGNHFKAVKYVLSEFYKGIPIYGIFIAHSVPA